MWVNAYIRKRKRYGVKKDKYYARIDSIHIYVLKSKGSATFLKYMQGCYKPPLTSPKYRTACL